MGQCPACEDSTGQWDRVRGVAGGERLYRCRLCNHRWTTVEVPEPYLRELIARSLELAALKAGALR